MPEPLPLFCYPHGKPEAINGAAVAAVRAAGLAGACTMVPGINIVGRTNPYLLFRIGMQAGETLPRFIFKLTAPARLLWQMKGLARALPV